ncbi:MAG: HPF/RaiA family ribosome-associated protein [Rhodospirillaceae bacterium]|jgi:ribosome-associated translation inhibitor RaiA|nr:HPF/RaiA family ribosome-associated protein [Rhodospirillaceae bacterium]
MQIPAQITFHGIDHSDAVEKRIHEKIFKLERIYRNIIRCRVKIETQHQNTNKLHHKPFHITINVTVPGYELIVNRDPKEPHINENINIALREAFDNMEQKLKDWINTSNV